MERARIVGRGRNNDALAPASNESASAACLSLSTTSAPCVPPSEWLPAAAGRVSAVLPCRFRALSSSTSIPRAGRQAGLATARAYPREALRSREGTSSARTRLPPPQQRRGHRARPRKAPQRTMRSASRESTVQALQGLRLPRPTLLPSARLRHSQARRSQTRLARAEAQGAGGADLGGVSLAPVLRDPASGGTRSRAACRARSTKPRTRSCCSRDTSGPIVVAASSGLPTTTAAIFSSTRSTTVSYTHLTLPTKA